MGDPPPATSCLDTLTFPIATGQEETRRDAIETIEAIRRISRAHPEVQTTLGLSNVSFGLSPAARQVLNSVFLHQCVPAGLDSAPSSMPPKILPMSKIGDEQREVALDMVYDRRRPGYDPLQRYLQLFEGVDVAVHPGDHGQQELPRCRCRERLERRIVDGERNGLEADLDAALAERPALEIINDTLLTGMKTVGELFGSGQMQLPFVLQSAEVMKTAVGLPGAAHGEDRGRRKGTIVLATVKGDVHDIGKNLVDIILSNNGYPSSTSASSSRSTRSWTRPRSTRPTRSGCPACWSNRTVMMSENLQEMNAGGLSAPLPRSCSAGRP